MNIYCKKDKDLRKINKKFMETAYGRKAYVLSCLPALFVVVSIFAMVITDFTIGNEELALILTVTFFGLLVLLFALAGITQLLYGMMLRDYAKSVKEGEK